ncbi:MAG: hypothetical protein AB3N10_01580 [Allomuricauda sp.]|uniref:hypothetical protein n=1 Tax=Flagellimonas algicola TaxID=2583815 RepID=UPI0013867F1D|nr:hypothetical protein [Allomuricauda algicola]
MMRKVVSIFAVVVLTMGLFSCEADSVSETENLMESLEDQNATGGNKSDDDRQ